MTLRATLKALLVRDDGNFAILSALLLLPLMGVIGLAVDIASALEARSQVEQAADAAALASLATDYQAFLPAGSGFPHPDPDEEEEKVRAFFRSQLPPGKLGNARVDFDPKREASTQRVVTTGSYRLSVPSTFLKLVGIPEIDLTGKAAATTALFPYSQIHVLVDNSPSMSVAATQADQSRLVALTGCAHACHSSDKKITTIEQARNARIPLRLDTVREAVASLGNLVEQKRQVANQFTMNLYSFGKTNTEHRASPISSLGTGITEMGQFRARVSSVDVIYLNRADDVRQASDMPAALSKIKGLIPVSGSGGSADDPAQILLLVSDGVAHDDKFITCLGSNSNTTCVEPVDPDDCQKIKDKGIRLAVVRTEFTPMEQDNRYRAFIKAYLPRIKENMKACASPGLYIEMNENDDPVRVMQEIFIKSVLTSRLTQ